MLDGTSTSMTQAMQNSVSCVNAPNLANSAGSRATSTGSSPLQHLTFPVKLHAMLSEIEQTGVHSHILTWRPHGRLFVVKDRQRLIKEVLPWYVQQVLLFCRDCILTFRLLSFWVLYALLALFSVGSSG
jgi:HSF-type DNA-binding